MHTETTAIWTRYQRKEPGRMCVPVHTHDRMKRAESINGTQESRIASRVQTVKPEIFWLDKSRNYMVGEKLNMCFDFVRKTHGSTFFFLSIFSSFHSLEHPFSGLLKMNIWRKSEHSLRKYHFEFRNKCHTFYLLWKLKLKLFLKQSQNRF